MLPPACSYEIREISIGLTASWNMAPDPRYLPVFREQVGVTNSIFITALSPVSLSYFASGEQIRNNLEVKLYKMCLMFQGQSTESAKRHM